MNVDLIVTTGHAPWLPNDAAGELDVWAADDVPTVGTFKMGEETVLFATALEPDEYTTWVYVPLKPQESARLDDLQFESPEEMWTFVEALFDGRTVVLADAMDYVLDLRSELDSSRGMLPTMITHLKWAATRYRQLAAESRAKSRQLRAAAPIEAVTAWEVKVNMTSDLASGAEERLDITKRMLAASH